MLIGRTKHIVLLNIKIQASSDNNRISLFTEKRKRKKKTNILVMCYGVFCCCFLLLFFCMFTQFKSVYIVIKLVVHYYKYQCQLLARWRL